MLRNLTSLTASLPARFSSPMKPVMAAVRSTALTLVPLSSTRTRAGVTWMEKLFHWPCGLSAAASAVGSAGSVDRAVAADDRAGVGGADPHPVAARGSGRAVAGRREVDGRGRRAGAPHEVDAERVGATLLGEGPGRALAAEAAQGAVGLEAEAARAGLVPARGGDGAVEGGEGAVEEAGRPSGDGGRRRARRGRGATGGCGAADLDRVEVEAAGLGPSVVGVALAVDGEGVGAGGEGDVGPGPAPPLPAVVLVGLTGDEGGGEVEHAGASRR